MKIVKHNSKTVACKIAIDKSIKMIEQYTQDTGFNKNNIIRTDRKT